MLIFKPWCEIILLLSITFKMLFNIASLDILLDIIMTQTEFIVRRFSSIDQGYQAAVYAGN